MKQQTITDWSQVPVILDLPFASRLLGFSVDALKKRAQRGQLAGAYRDGGHWRISRDVLRGHIERQAVSGQ